MIGAGSATLYFLSDTDVKIIATTTEITDHETTSKEIPLPGKQSIITEKEPSHNSETAPQVNEAKPMIPVVENEAAPIHNKVTTTTGLKGASAILKSLTSKNAVVPDKAVTENGSLTFEYIQAADPSQASPQQQDNNSLPIMALEPLPPADNKLAYENPVAVWQPPANQIPITSFKPSRFSISGEITPLISWINYGNQSGLGLTYSDQLMADSVSNLNQSNSKPLIGFSTGISGSYRISERFALSTGANKAYLNMKYDTRYDDPKDTNRFFFRSDHFNYAVNGIPIAFWFDGVHVDYHGAGDHADKIDYVRMEKVTRTIMLTMLKLADLKERPKIDKQLPPELSQR